jgi:hypothetical protein
MNAAGSKSLPVRKTPCSKNWRTRPRCSASRGPAACAHFFPSSLLIFGMSARRSFEHPWSASSRPKKPDKERETARYMQNCLHFGRSSECDRTQARSPPCRLRFGMSVSPYAIGFLRLSSGPWICMATSVARHRSPLVAVKSCLIGGSYRNAVKTEA